MDFLINTLLILEISDNGFEFMLQYNIWAWYELDYKESLLYIVFGIFTVIISVVSFFAFYEFLNFNELIANVYSWIFAVVFAFITNKIYVFKSYDCSINITIMQFFMFVSSRLLTLLLEEVILFIFVSMLLYSALPVKCFAQILVIIVNYILSKKVIFK